MQIQQLKKAVRTIIVTLVILLMMAINCFATERNGEFLYIPWGSHYQIVNKVVLENNFTQITRNQDYLLTNYTYTGQYKGREAQIATFLFEHQLYSASFIYSRNSKQEINALWDQIVPDLISQYGQPRILIPYQEASWYFDEDQIRCKVQHIVEPGYNKSFLSITHADKQRLATAMDYKNKLVAWRETKL